jgi:hypothetical protein
MVNSNFTGVKAKPAEIAAAAEIGACAVSGAMNNVAAGWLTIVPFPTKVAVGSSR